MLDIFAMKIEESLIDRIDEAYLCELLKYLDPDKRVQVMGLRREDLRVKRLMADLFIRHIIIEKTGLDNSDVIFVKNEFGKPFLEDYEEEFQFNISHSGDWVVGVIDNRPVGIDVEEVQPIDLGICNNYFSTDEQLDLENKEDQLGYFYTLWTLKESFIKIYGTGLWLPLNCFTMKYFSREQIAILVEGRPVGGACFKNYDIDKFYKMAVCATRDNFPEYVKTLSPDQVLDKFKI